MNGEDDDDPKQHQNIMLSIPDTEVINLDAICRVCANSEGRIISIYSEEGMSHDLPVKMNMYLPTKVDEVDTLPLQCCWSCASTVLAWHEFVVRSVEADRRLKELLLIASKTVVEESFDSPSLPDFEAESTGASLTVFCESTSADDDVAVQSTQAPERINLQILKPEEINEISSTSLADDIKIDISESKVSIGDPPKSVKPKKAKVTKKSCRQRQEGKATSKSSSKCSEKDRQPETYHFACQYCPFVFLNEEDILQHVKEKHSDEIDLMEPDPLLPTLNKKQRRKHTKIDQDVVNAAKVVVEGRVYYNCKICGKSLHSPYTYMWHIRIHTGERPYVCDLCGKQFRVSQGLVRHLRETHQGIKNFPCDLCGRMFATRRNVEEHRRIHTNERPYICDLCGKAFKQKASLFVHNRSHSNYFPYRCSYCGQGFRTRPPLLIHVTRHTGEKPYPCDICGRYFRIKYELKRHRLVHSDEKPFSCAECGLSFRQKRYLRNHNKINHNRSAT